jgi:hypothetical protein
MEMQLSASEIQLVQLEVQVLFMEVELSILETQPVRAEMRLVKMDVQLSSMETERVTTEMVIRALFSTAGASASNSRREPSKAELKAS